VAFKLSRAAAKDLEFIWFYTAERWSLDQADDYLGLIFEGIALLEQNPLSGKDRSELRTGYRSVPVKSHVIFYRIKSPKLIEIVRILHERMDFGSQMG
jgi:toxin ParE1/3/4